MTKYNVYSGNSEYPIMTCDNFKKVQKIMQSVTHPHMIITYNRVVSEMEIKGWSRSRMVELWKSAESCLYSGYVPRGYNTKESLELQAIVELNCGYMMEIMGHLQEYRDQTL